jgi:hypothetical protein
MCPVTHRSCSGRSILLNGVHFEVVAKVGIFDCSMEVCEGFGFGGPKRHANRDFDCKMQGLGGGRLAGIGFWTSVPAATEPIGTTGLRLKRCCGSSPTVPVGAGAEGGAGGVADVLATSDVVRHRAGIHGVESLNPPGPPQPFRSKNLQHPYPYVDSLEARQRWACGHILFEEELRLA